MELDTLTKTYYVGTKYLFMQIILFTIWELLIHISWSRSATKTTSSNVENMLQTAKEIIDEYQFSKPKLFFFFLKSKRKKEKEKRFQ
jgi:hypothetical protein